MDSFDYVIVGAGSAGAVLASRLSEHPGVTVALLEAGPRDWHPFIHIPAGFIKTFYNKRVNWAYSMEPSEWTGEAEQPWFASGLAEANLIHDSWGFSQFTLQTPKGSHRIGRLGNRLFRVTDGRVLSDDCVLAALKSLSPARNLVCIDEVDSFVDPLPDGAVIKATSARLGGSLDEVLGSLSGFLAF